MTIQEAINDCREKRPNQYNDEDLIKWLSDVEWSLVMNVYSRYEGFENEKAFTGYAGDADQSTKLFAPAPFDNIYRYWLYSMVDFHNNDITRYNMAATMYSGQLEAFEVYMIQNHKPLPKPGINHTWIQPKAAKDIDNPLA